MINSLTRGLKSCMVGLIIVSVFMTSLSAAVFNVDRTTDPFPGSACSDAVADDCSLRDAIVASNNNAGPDIIRIPAGTYILTRGGAGEDAATTGDLDVTEAVLIEGAGMDSTIVDAGGDGGILDRIFHFHDVMGSEIQDLTVRGGRQNLGAGILVDQPNPTAAQVATLTRVRIKENVSPADSGGIHGPANGNWSLIDCEVLDNTSISGGGVGHFGSGELTVNGGEISRNDAVIGGGAWSSGTAKYTGVMILDNDAEQGGGLALSVGNTTIIDSIIKDNLTDGGLGGGIFNSSSTVEVFGSVISENHSDAGKGGGIYNNGVITLTNSTIDNNTAGSDGVAVYSQSGLFGIVNSTISNHSSAGQATINLIAGEGKIYNSTVSGNTTTLASVIKVESGATLLFWQSTFFNNDATLVSEISTSNTPGDGISFSNSIIQGSCFGSRYETLSGNLISPLFGCGLDNTNGDFDNIADLKLGPLMNNGGDTETHAVLVGSPAIDVALGALCISFEKDQRGSTRFVDFIPSGLVCDSGAYELQFLSDDIFVDGFEP